MSEAAAAREPEPAVTRLGKLAYALAALVIVVDQLSKYWVLEIRRVVTGALEIARRDKVIGSSLEAAPILYLDASKTLAHPRECFDGVEAADLFITSGVTFEDGPGPQDAFRLPDVGFASVVMKKAEGRKCARSWKVLPEVQRNHERLGLDLTDRDVDAVAWWDARHGAAA